MRPFFIVMCAGLPPGICHHHHRRDYRCVAFACAAEARSRRVPTPKTRSREVRLAATARSARYVIFGARAAGNFTIVRRAAARGLVSSAASFTALGTKVTQLLAGIRNRAYFRFLGSVSRDTISTANVTMYACSRFIAPVAKSTVSKKKKEKK